MIVTSPWARPRCWIYLLFLTWTAAVLALLGAADLTSAAVMIGAGFILDVIRWIFQRDRLTNAYWIRRVERSLSDPASMITQRRTYRWAAFLPTVLVFLLHGILWVALAPAESGLASPAAAEMSIGTKIILHASHLARGYQSGLAAHGYPGRAALVASFVFQTFVIYTAGLVIWTFFFSYWEAEEYLITIYHRHRKGSDSQISYPRALAGLAGLTVAGFVLINNATFIDWTGGHARQAVQSSNSFFITYDTLMMLSFLAIIFIPPYSMLYCLRLDMASISSIRTKDRPRDAGPSRTSLRSLDV